MAFLGDTAFFEKNTSQNKRCEEILSPIKKALEKYNYVIANLKCPLTLQRKNVGGKSAYLKGNPEDVKILKYLGVTHVTFANNHICDYR